MQIEMLETKLAIFLPTIPRAQLIIGTVLPLFEKALGKPSGRLNRFKGDIDAVIRRYVDTLPLYDKDIVAPDVPPRRRASKKKPNK